jgi:Phytochelatin synthase
MKSQFKIASWLLLFHCAPGVASPKYGPEGAPQAVPLVQATDYFRQAPAPDYWAMAGFYVPQFNGAACSVASVTMALNAARAKLAKNSESKVITQQALLSQIGGEWKKRVDPTLGLSKVRGVTLDLLAKFAEEAFHKNGFEKARAEVVRLDPKFRTSLQRLQADLAENEKSDSDFILINFDQKLFTDDSEAGHISPVAAYDSKNHRVLVMDPDREWYEPYWVSDQRLLEAMATIDPETRQMRGYVRITR